MGDNGNRVRPDSQHGYGAYPQMIDPYNWQSNGYHLNRSQSEFSHSPLPGIRQGHPPYPRPQFKGEYFHLSGSPMQQSQIQNYPGPPDHALQHSQSYPQFPPRSQAFHPQSSSRPVYGTTSAYPNPGFGYSANFGHASSSRANSTHQLAMGRFDAQFTGSKCLPTGELMITVHKARGIKGKELGFVGKPVDPYAELTLDDQTLRTKTRSNAGSKPIWDSTLQFLVKSKDIKYNKLSIKIYNDNSYPRNDNILGYLTILNLGQVISQIQEKLSTANWYPVYRHGEERGQILLAFRFFPRTAEQLLNCPGNQVRPAANVQDPKAEYTKMEMVSGIIQILLQGTAIGLAVAAL